MLSLLMCQIVLLKDLNGTYNTMPVDGRRAAHLRVRQLIVDFDLKSHQNLNET
jgi:hypothetical protein